MEQRRVVAMGGFPTDPKNSRLDRFVLSLARSETPGVCFVPTASGDADGYVQRAFAGRELMEVVVARPGARGYRLQRMPDGEAGEQVLPARYLGAQPTDRE